MAGQGDQIPNLNHPSFSCRPHSPSTFTASSPFPLWRPLQSGALVNDSGACRHTCPHHAEVMDPCLWSGLPEHLLAQVFAQLPMRQLFTVRSLSKVWAAMSKNVSFKQLCAKFHPKTFAILGHYKQSKFQVTAFDLQNHTWLYHELKRDLPKEYREPSHCWHTCNAGALYAQDGGLVCFVPIKNLPILVCNPLTNEWKTLPPNYFSRERPIMVQLVTDANTGGYKVMLVCRHKQVSDEEDSVHGSEEEDSRSSSEEEDSGEQDLDQLRRISEEEDEEWTRSSEIAEVYDSKTGLWSKMNSGYIYGFTDYATTIFDCKSRDLLLLNWRVEEEEQLPENCCSAIVKNHLFVLHDTPDLVYGVSELAGGQEEPYISGRLNLYQSPLSLSEFKVQYGAQLFACDGYILFVVDNHVESFSEWYHQLVWLYDMSRQEWHKLPVLNDMFTDEQTRSHFMCELRWDAFP